jgi:hypothetical protein
MRVTDRVGVPRVMQFICWKLEGHDCSKVVDVELVPTAGDLTFSGKVQFSATQSRGKSPRYQDFRIRGWVNPSPRAYPMAFTHEVRAPDPGPNESHTFKKACSVFRGKETTALFVLSHEVAHFLMLTKQWPLRNCEGNANWIAHKWLDEYLGRKWSAEDVVAGRRYADLIHAHDPLF